MAVAFGQLLGKWRVLRLAIRFGLRVKQLADSVEGIPARDLGIPFVEQNVRTLDVEPPGVRAYVVNAHTWNIRAECPEPVGFSGADILVFGSCMPSGFEQVGGFMKFLIG